MKRIRKTWRRRSMVVAALCGVICFVAGFAAGANESRPVPARAVELSGKVLVNYAGKGTWQDLYRMEGVRDGDRVCTGPDGEVSLKCKDDTLVTLFPLSGMEIGEFSVETRDGRKTAVTELVFTQGRVDITPVASGRYESDFTLAVSDLLFASGCGGHTFSAMVGYVPETETVGVVWRGGGGIITVPAGHPGVVEVVFGADIVGDVSFSREASSDSEVDAIVLTIAAGPMDAAVDAVIDRIVIRDDISILLSGRTTGSAVSLFSGGETVYLDAPGGFWETELVVDAGAPFSPEPIASGAPGDMPDFPAVTEDMVLASREGEKAPGSSAGEERNPPGDERDVTRVARSFLSDFIGAVEEGDTTDLSGMIDPSYSGIGGSRSGLIGLVRDYFNEASTLRISWSVVSIDKTEEMVIATITWSSSAGASGASTFWLSDSSGGMSLSHAEGDWFF